MEVDVTSSVMTFKKCDKKYNKSFDVNLLLSSRAGHDHAQAVVQTAGTGYLVSAQMAGRARSTVTPRLARSRLETHAVCV